MLYRDRVDMVGPRVLLAIAIVVATLALFGVFAPSALGTTPTTMSWMTTIPDPENAAPEDTAAVATVISPGASTPVPSAIEAGAGGSADSGGGLWILATLAAGLGSGMCLSALKLRRQGMRRL